MPKDEFDPEDPMELCGVALHTDEDTSEAMAECFVEEFLRLGYNHKQVFALFRNPHYLGMNMVLQNRGERFVRDTIARVFAQWGRAVNWPQPAEPAPGADRLPPQQHTPLPAPALGASPELPASDNVLIDPMGMPVPPELSAAPLRSSCGCGHTTSSCEARAGENHGSRD
jgi:hypothetical protein